MKDSLHFSETADRLIISIFPSLKPIVKFGLVLQGIISIGASFFFIWIFFSEGVDSLLGFLLVTAFAAVCFLAGKSFLKRVCYKEIIEVSHQKLVITEKHIFQQKRHVILLSEMESIGFVGQYDYTSHPMENPIVYFTGLAVQEKSCNM